MASAFAVAACLTAAVFAVFGAGERGAYIALQVTARWSFLLFWPAYAGGALALLFGPAFRSLKQHARTFGLAFAAAHLVHMALVGWLCWLGAPPLTGVFVFFSVPLVFVYVLALSSIGWVQHLLGRAGWKILRLVGMNYIAYAFLADFWKYPDAGRLEFIAGYIPFIAISLVGALFYWMAFLIPLWKPRKALS